MSRRALAVVAAIVLVVAAVALIALSVANRPDDSATTSTPSPGSTSPSEPTETATVTARPSPVPSAPATADPTDGADATALVTPYLAAEAAARQDPETPLELPEVSSGSALEDLQIQLDELGAGGLTQDGAPTVVSAEVTDTDLTAEPPRATVLVCLDYSQVDIVNADGESVKDSTAPQRVPTILELVEEDGGWLVERRTFPPEPTC